MVGGGGGGSLKGSGRSLIVDWLVGRAVGKVQSGSPNEAVVRQSNITAILRKPLFVVGYE